MSSSESLSSHPSFDYHMADILKSKISHLKDCDLVFLVVKRRYYAHSFLLFNVCRSIKKFLINEKSSTMKYTCQLKITPCHGLELLLVYIYTSRLMLNIYTICDLFLAASELDVERIIQRCIQFMNESIQKMYDNSENVCRFEFVIK